MFGSDDGASAFAAHFVHVGETVTSFHYDGSVEGSYDGPSLWNGSGRIERDGPFGPSGTVTAQTTNELIDGSACAGEPLSGQTTLKSDGQTAVVDYDGSTDCDTAHSARLRVDGEDRGTISGISCDLVPAAPRRSRKVDAAIVTLATLLYWRQSRRRRATVSRSSTSV